MNSKKITQYFMLLSISLISVMFAHVFSRLGLVQEIQLKSVNALFAVRGPVVPQDSSIVIVAVDDDALASLPGKWPYPTFYYTKLVTNLKEAGAKAIIFDIEFTEPNLDHPEYDIAFARAITEAQNVVLAGKIVFDVGSYGTESIRILKPIPPLLKTQAAWGIVNVIEDSDGFLRRYILFQNIGKKLYFPLAIEALRLTEKLEILEGLTLNAKRFQVGNHDIPKITSNTMYINFRGATLRSFKTISMAQVIDDSTFSLPGEEDVNSFYLHRDWGTFRDKIVFIGATAEELQDLKFTPFYQYDGQKRKMPGVEFHANALSTILDKDYIRDMDPWIALLFVLILTTITSILTIRLRPFKALVAVGIILISTVILICFIFIMLRLIVPLTMPVLSLLFCFTITLVFQIFTEQKEKARIRQTFQHYVAPNIVDKMLSSGELPSFGGERRELTILFSDIRRFTAFSETREPEIVVSRLSEYLTEMVDIIFKNNGTLDKFVGDEIMALYGAPYYYEDHALRACRTSLQMMEKLKEIQKKWSADNKEYFHIGIGINSGNVIVGNLGSAQLFDYTVIGDEVNLAARLQGANKKYESTIIISETTFDKVKEKVIVRELDIVRVIGRKQPIRIYELRGMDRLPQIEQDYLIDVFSEGLHFYRQRRWADALRSFRRVLRYFPSDGPARLYTIRCLDYIENAPAITWEGIYELEEK